MALDVFESSQSAVKTLFGQDRDFDFSHIEPPRMLGRVMPGNALEEFAGLLTAECFDQRLGVVSIQIVEHQMNPPGLGITLQEITDEPREVSPPALPASLNEPFAGLGFYGDKQTACATAALLVVLFSRPAWAGRLRWAGMIKQLVWLFIQANHGFASIERLFILIEHVFHPLTKFFRELGNAPRFFRHGLRS